MGGKEEGLFKPRAVNEVEAERDRAPPMGGGGRWSTHTHDRDAHGHACTHVGTRERLSSDGALERPRGVGGAKVVSIRS